MKLSVSLPDEDVAILDEFARTAGFASRSAALQHAVRMLRLSELEHDYEAAWTEWEAPMITRHGRSPPPTGWLMLRGDICLVDLEPVRGSEANKDGPPSSLATTERTLSQRGSSTGLSPSSRSPATPSGSTRSRHCFLPLPLACDRLKAQAEQVRSITVERLGAVLGHVPAAVMADVDDALRLHLQL